MGPGGVEPPTSRLSGVRSNHLSYRPRSSLPIAAGGLLRLELLVLVVVEFVVQVVVIVEVVEVLLVAIVFVELVVEIVVELFVLLELLELFVVVTVAAALERPVHRRHTGEHRYLRLRLSPNDRPNLRLLRLQRPRI